MHKTSYQLIEPLRVLIPRAHEDVYNNKFIVESLRELIMSNKVSLTFPSFGSKYIEFKNYVEQFVGDKISYYDKKIRADYLQFSSTFDLYLSASKSDSSPVSLIEAMALGLIPVAGDILGVKEWLTESSGFLFDLQDKQSLEDTISKILSSHTDFGEMRNRNKATVEREGIFEDSITDQILIFREIVGANDV